MKISWPKLQKWGGGQEWSPYLMCLTIMLALGLSYTRFMSIVWLICKVSRLKILDVV